MNTLGDFLPALLFDVALKGTAILVLTAVGALALRRASAASRHLIWAAGLVSLLVLPLLSALLPAWRILPGWTELPAAATVVNEPPMPMVRPMPLGAGGLLSPEMGPRVVLDVQAPVDVEPAALPDVQERATARPAVAAPVVSATPEAPKVRWSFTAWVLIVYAVGAGLMLLPLIFAPLFLRRLRKQASVLEGDLWGGMFAGLAALLNVRRRVALLLSRRKTVPMTFGVFWPVILLPVDATSWPSARRRIVLLHELAHVARRDCLTSFLARLAKALFWWHPLAWLANAGMAMEAERACDDLVLSAGTRSSDYAEELLSIAAAIHPTRGMHPAGALPIARLSTLEGRIRSILAQRMNRSSLTRLVVVATVILMAGIITPFACMRSAVPLPVGAEPTSESNAFLTYEDQKKGDTWTSSLLVSTIHADGSVATRTLPGDQFQINDRLKKVVDGRLIVGNAASDAKSGYPGMAAIDLSVPKREAYPGADDGFVWRGDNALGWERRPISSPIVTSSTDSKGESLHLVRRTADGRVESILPNARVYTAWDRMEWSFIFPALAWLDDDHAIAFRDNPSRVPELVIVNLQTKAVVPVPLDEPLAAYDDPEIIAPPGSQDIAIIFDPALVDNERHSLSRLRVLSIADALAGHAKLENRPLRWGHFTLGGRIASNTRAGYDDFSRTDTGAVWTESLAFDGRVLAGPAYVSVSPDGTKVLWKASTGQMVPERESEALMFFDSTTRKTAVIASGKHYHFPVWTTKAALGAPAASRAAEPSTKPAADAAKAVVRFKLNTDNLVGYGLTAEDVRRELAAQDGTSDALGDLSVGTTSGGPDGHGMLVRLDDLGMPEAGTEDPARKTFVLAGKKVQLYGMLEANGDFGTLLSAIRAPQHWGVATQDGTVEPFGLEAGHGVEIALWPDSPPAKLVPLTLWIMEADYSGKTKPPSPGPKTPLAGAPVELEKWNGHRVFLFNASDKAWNDAESQIKTALAGTSGPLTAAITIARGPVEDKLQLTITNRSDQPLKIAQPLFDMLSRNLDDTDETSDFMSHWFKSDSPDDAGWQARVATLPPGGQLNWPLRPTLNVGVESRVAAQYVGEEWNATKFGTWQGLVYAAAMRAKMDANHKITLTPWTSAPPVAPPSNPASTPPDPFLTLVQNTIDAPLLTRPSGDGRFFHENATALDFKSILILNKQDQAVTNFPTENQKWDEAIKALADQKQIWALSALLNHDNADVKILAAKALLQLADARSVPALLAAAKANNYGGKGSETATIHMIYRETLKQALEKITGLKLTPPGLVVTTDTNNNTPPVWTSEEHPEKFPQEVAFDRVELWLLGEYLQPSFDQLQNLLNQSVDSPVVKGFVARYRLHKGMANGRYAFTLDNNDLPFSLRYNGDRIEAIWLRFAGGPGAIRAAHPYKEPLAGGVLPTDTRDQIIARLGPPDRATSDSLIYKTIEFAIPQPKNSIVEVYLTAPPPVHRVIQIRPNPIQLKVHGTTLDQIRRLIVDPNRSDPIESRFLGDFGSPRLSDLASFIEADEQPGLETLKIGDKTFQLVDPANVIPAITPAPGTTKPAPRADIGDKEITSWVGRTLAEIPALSQLGTPELSSSDEPTGHTETFWVFPDNPPARRYLTVWSKDRTITAAYFAADLNTKPPVTAPATAPATQPAAVPPDHSAAVKGRIAQRANGEIILFQGGALTTFPKELQPQLKPFINQFVSVECTRSRKQPPGQLIMMPRAGIIVSIEKITPIAETPAKLPVEITIKPAKEKFAAGEPIEYTVTFTNHGPGTTLSLYAAAAHLCQDYTQPDYLNLDPDDLYNQPHPYGLDKLERKQPLAADSTLSFTTTSTHKIPPGTYQLVYLVSVAADGFDYQSEIVPLTILSPTLELQLKPEHSMWNVRDLDIKKLAPGVQGFAEKIPTFYVDAHNNGADTFEFGTAYPAFDIEVDGKLYKYNGPINMESVRFRPGEKITNIEIPLSARWTPDLPLTPGNHTIRVVFTKGDQKIFSNPAQFDIAADPATAPAIHATSIQGQVFDQPNGKPLPNITVELNLYNTDEKPRKTTTDASGNYQFNNIDPAAYGASIQLVTQNIGWSEDVQMSLSKLTDPNVHAPPLYTALTPVSGQILDADTGKPVPHAEVAVFTAQTTGGGLADDQGKFHFNLRPGKIEIECRGTRDRYYDAPEKQAFTITDQPLNNITLKVKSAVALTGQILSSDKKPVANAQIMAVAQWSGNTDPTDPRVAAAIQQFGIGKPGDHEDIGMAQHDYAGLGTHFTTTSDKDGNFILYLRRPTPRTAIEAIKITLIAHTPTYNQFNSQTLNSTTLNPTIPPVQLQLKDAAWGDAVDGVRLRLSPGQSEWNADRLYDYQDDNADRSIAFFLEKNPVFHLDVQNNGTESPIVAGAAPGYTLELDGKPYTFQGPVNMRSGPLPPGRSMDNIEFQLAAEWGPDFPKLTPGKHTVRAIYTKGDKKIPSNLATFTLMPPPEAAPATTRAAAPDPFQLLVQTALNAPINQTPPAQGQQSPTGLDFSTILAATGQDKDLANFPKDHTHFADGMKALVDAKKIWAICALLDHENVDAKIDAARALLQLADPQSLPALLAAAKANSYIIPGSEDATLHDIYRTTLKQGLEAITGLNLTPDSLGLGRFPRPTSIQIDFANASRYIIGDFQQPSFAEMQKLLNQPIDSPAIKEFVARNQLSHGQKFDEGDFMSFEYGAIDLLYRANRIDHAILTINRASDSSWPKSPLYRQPLPNGVLPTDTPEDVVRHLGPATHQPERDYLAYDATGLTFTFDRRTHILLEMYVAAPSLPASTKPAAENPVPTNLYTGPTIIRTGPLIISPNPSAAPANSPAANPANLQLGETPTHQTLLDQLKTSQTEPHAVLLLADMTENTPQFLILAPDGTGSHDWLRPDSFGGQGITLKPEAVAQALKIVETLPPEKPAADLKDILIVQVKKGDTFESKEFDLKNPPKEIRQLLDTLNDPVLKYFMPTLAPASAPATAPATTAAALPAPDPIQLLVKAALNAPVDKGPTGKTQQSPTGLDFKPILTATDQDKDLAAFPQDHTHFDEAIKSLADAKKVWAICALLDHENVDAKVFSARALLQLADPQTLPALLAAAKANNYIVIGSEDATLHSIYRSTLKQALEKITGLKLTPDGLRITEYPQPNQPRTITSDDHPERFPENIAFDRVESWLIAKYLQPTAAQLQSLLNQPIDSPAIQRFIQTYHLTKTNPAFGTNIANPQGYFSNPLMPFILNYQPTDLAHGTISRIVIAVDGKRDLTGGNPGPATLDALPFTPNLPNSLSRADSPDDVVRRLGPPTERRLPMGAFIRYDALRLTIHFDGQHIAQLDLDAPPLPPSSTTQPALINIEHLNQNGFETPTRQTLLDQLKTSQAEPHAVLLLADMTENTPQFLILAPDGTGSHDWLRPDSFGGQGITLKPEAVAQALKIVETLPPEKPAADLKDILIVQVKKGDTFESKEFDLKNPPKEIRQLLDTLNDPVLKYFMPTLAPASAPATAATKAAAETLVPFDQLKVFPARPLPAANGIAGHLLDSDGKPIPNATIFLPSQKLASQPSNLYIHDGLIDEPAAQFGKGLRTTTADDGYFSLTPAVDSAQFLLIGKAPTLAWVVPSFQLGKETVVQLPKPAAFAIHYDIPGAPDSSEFSIIFHPQDTPGWANKLYNASYKISIKNGQTATVGNLIPGTYEIQRRKQIDVILSGGTNVPLDWPNSFELAAGETKTVDFTRKGIAVKGKIVGFQEFALTGAHLDVYEPLPESGLLPNGAAPRQFDIIATGPDGSFQTEQLPPGKYTIIAAAELPPPPLNNMTEVTPLGFAPNRVQFNNRLVGRMDITVPAPGADFLPIQIQLKPQNNILDLQIPRLVSLLASPDEHERIVARQLLLDIDKKRVMPALQAAAQSKDSALAQAAQKLFDELK